LSRPLFVTDSPMMQAGLRRTSCTTSNLASRRGAPRRGSHSLSESALRPKPADSAGRCRNPLRRARRCPQRNPQKCALTCQRHDAPRSIALRVIHSAWLRKRHLQRPETRSQTRSPRGEAKCYQADGYWRPGQDLCGKHPGRDGSTRGRAALSPEGGSVRPAMPRVPTGPSYLRLPEVVTCPFTSEFGTASVVSTGCPSSDASVASLASAVALA